MEIIVDNAYSEDQVLHIDMHGILNIINVVQYEALNLSKRLDDVKVMDDFVELTVNTGKNLQKEKQSKKTLENIESFIESSERILDNLLVKVASNDLDYFNEIRENLNGIYEILRTRAGEILRRIDNPNHWVNMEISLLKENFYKFIRAIEKNSHGAYHIVHNLANHEEGNYLINFEIDSPNNDSIFMPPVFQDVMRDLLANARKYTPPGGRIMAGFYQYEDKLRYIIEDNGIGILKKDLPGIVTYGIRGSNLQNRPTRGGGFGLTKAYYVTKLFNGRMWINSPIKGNKGTQIIIELPIDKK